MKKLERKLSEMQNLMFFPQFPVTTLNNAYSQNYSVNPTIIFFNSLLIMKDKHFTIPVYYISKIPSYKFHQLIYD